MTYYFAEALLTRTAASEFELRTIANQSVKPVDSRPGLR